jgi:2-iminobutanoate/2-iminopropanoate deaminase
MIYTSGQLGRDPATGKLAGPTMREQARRALANLKAVVEAGGGSLRSIVKIEGLVTDLDMMGEFNEVFKEFFPVDPPARCCFEVRRLAAGALVEVSAVAVVEEPD